MDTVLPGQYDTDSGIEHVEKLIAMALKGLRFGSLEIIVHNGRIVQLEKHEKIRLEYHK